MTRIQASSADSKPPRLLERQWIEQARRGDREAMTALIETHQHSVYTLSLNLCGGNEAMAQDLAQDALVRVLRGLQSFGGQSSFATWLHRIVVNSYLNLRRGGRLRRTQSLDGGASDGETAVPVPAAEQPEPVDKLVLEEELEILETALKRLDKPRRTVIVLRDLLGLSYEEIAEILQLKIGTVRSRIARGRQDLLEFMTKRPPINTAAGRPAP